MITPFPIDNVFTLDECRKIIATALLAPRVDAALVGGNRLSNIRRSENFWLDDAGAGTWIFRQLLKTIAAANRAHFNFDLTEFLERMQVARYDEAKSGFFDWHMDCGTGPLAAQRKLTIVVQLSEENGYDGGCLETNADGHIVTASRKIGSALILPSFILHHVTPVTRGERYSLTLWAHGPGFR